MGHFATDAHLGREVSTGPPASFFLSRSKSGIPLEKQHCMNTSRGISCIVFFLLALASACSHQNKTPQFISPQISGEEGTPFVTGAATELEGVWRTECNSLTTTSSTQNQWVFHGNQYQASVLNFNDAACVTRKEEHALLSGTFVINGMNESEPKAENIDFTVVDPAGTRPVLGIFYHVDSFLFLSYTGAGAPRPELSDNYKYLTKIP